MLPAPLPQAILSVIKVDGHFYAVPIDHMPGWIWYSKAAFKKAGIVAEPATVDQLFAALDKLKAAGLIALAHGGQPWQEHLIFMRMLADVGGKDLYLTVLRERDQRAIGSAAFRKVLLAFKRMQSYVDPGAPRRNWNDATALLIAGKAGVQIMGDWAKGELTAAHQLPGRDYGCLPVCSDLDGRSLDACTQAGMASMKDKARQVGFGEVDLTPDQNGAPFDLLTA